MMEVGRKVSLLGLNLALIALTVYLTLYFEQSSELNQFRFLPRIILIVLLIYILAQVIKRSVLRRREKYDWLYYIGLISILLPVFFPNILTFEAFKNCIRIGMLSFLVGPILDIYKILRHER